MKKIAENTFAVSFMATMIGFIGICLLAVVVFVVYPNYFFTTPVVRNVEWDMIIDAAKGIIASATLISGAVSYVSFKLARKLNSKRKGHR